MLILFWTQVWSGVVVEPEKPEGVIEWTVSMTWTEECDAEVS